jgi:hypothetical protein
MLRSFDGRRRSRRCQPLCRASRPRCLLSMKCSSRRWLPWGFAVTALVAWVGCRDSRTAVVAPLPTLDHVQKVVARYFDAGAKRDFRFEVPLDRLSSILGALQPATYDPRPANWEVLGELEMTLRSGRPFRVNLYSLSPDKRVRSDQRGAFSAGETFERRTYYRGGTSSQLIEALRLARDAATQAELANDATTPDQVPSSSRRPLIGP